MMKARSARVTGVEQIVASNRNKSETLGPNGTASQQSAAAQARKRRSSINVYDQPSSLNSRLRQLETDMLRLDEDRTKLFDDTHSALAQYELKLGEIHAILKSRQDNVEKYVGDMKVLLQAKEDFEKQTKLLNEKHDRIHEKFMHREIIISREIKLLKNKFEILEKNRQFRGMLQKSNQMVSSDSGGGGGGGLRDDDLSSGLEGSSEFGSRKRSETTTTQTSELGDDGTGSYRGDRLSSKAGPASKSVRINMSKLGSLRELLAPLFGSRLRRQRMRRGSRARLKSNRVSATLAAPASELREGADRGAAEIGGGFSKDNERGGTAEGRQATSVNHLESGMNTGLEGTAQAGAAVTQELAVPEDLAAQVSQVTKRGTFLTRLFARLK